MPCYKLRNRTRKQRPVRGYIVVLGNPNSHTANVLVIWAPIGGIQRVMDDVNRWSTEPITLLDYAPGTFDDCDHVRDLLAPYRYAGYWHTREALAQFSAMFPTELISEEEYDVAA